MPESIPQLKYKLYKFNYRIISIINMYSDIIFQYQSENSFQSKLIGKR